MQIEVAHAIHSSHRSFGDLTHGTLYTIDVILEFDWRNDSLTSCISVLVIKRREIKKKE